MSPAESGQMEEVIVVGHGPSPAGKGWGARIDRADRVIRMFDCGWQDPADYGARYDIGVMTLRKRQAAWFAREAVRRPTEWWAYDQDGHGVAISTPEPQTPVDVAAAQAEAVRQGGMGTGGFLTLTRGAAAACFAASQFAPRRLVLVGFDEVRARGFMSGPYPAACLQQIARRPDSRLIRRRMEARKPGDTRSAGHDLGVESAVIRWACAHAGTALNWAEDVFG